MSLRNTIKSIVDPVKDALDFVGREVIKPVVTLGGTFEIGETLTLASFLAGVDGYENMSEDEQAIYQQAYHQARANALIKGDSDQGFLSIGNNTVASRVRQGSAEANFASINRGSTQTQREPFDSAIKQMIMNSMGNDTLINDFSKMNELVKITDAFTVKPELNKDDTSKPTIKVEGS